MQSERAAGAGSGGATPGGETAPAAVPRPPTAPATDPDEGPARTPNWIFLSANASVGKKAIMAITGSILGLYVVVHLLGNLQIFQKPEMINVYAEFLKSKPGFLWGARAALLAAALLHVVVGGTLWFQNRAARPVRYAARKKNEQSTLASRTMIWTGALVLGFIIYHLLHLTVGSVNPPGYRFDAHDVYTNIVRGFSDPLFAGLYVVGMIFLFLHLSHGIQSLFLTFGFSHPKYEAGVRRASIALAFLIAAGNIAIVASVWFGWIG